MLDKFIDEKLRLLQEVPDNMLSAIDRVQIEGYKRVSVLLGRLDTDGLGNVLPTARNFGMIQQIEIELKNLLNGVEYLDASVQFAKGFRRSMEVNEGLFSQFSGTTITPNSIYQQTVFTAQRQSVAMITGEAGFQALNNPLVNMLNTAISTSMPLSSLLANIGEIMLGEGGRLGALAGHSYRIVQDSFAFADRSYSMMLAEDLNIEKWLYQGGMVSSTRAFCNCRNGKTFTKEEIEAWGKSTYSGCGTTAQGKWKGRHYETSPKTIWIVLGGYNCRHALIPTK